jgi:hypothetical protein
MIKAIDLSSLMKKVSSQSDKNLQPLPFGLEGDNTTRLCLMGGFILLAFIVMLVPAYLFDTRLIAGASVWSKPIKFSLSLSIHFITIAVLAQLIHRDFRTNKTMTAFAYAGVAGALFELIYITIQAGRGRASHFNFETAIEAFMYSMMGVAAIFLVAISFVLGVMILRFNSYKIETKSYSHLANKAANHPHTKKAAVDFNLGLRWGAISGLIMGSVLTLLLAGYMSSSGSALVSSTTESLLYSEETMPIFGWSLSQGDLRIPHFIATHLMQILPIIGLVCDKLKLSSANIKRVVVISAMFLVSVTTGLFILMTQGESMMSLF